MKNILYLSILLIVSFFVSCNNELDLNEKWEDIPITYGFLNSKDTVQYIRIEKVFNDPNNSALEVAQIKDSIYYDNIEVKIVDLNSGMDYRLEKIDGNLENHEREEGVFLQSPNYLYKLSGKGKIIADREYSLIVIKKDGDTLTTATTRTVDNIKIYNPISTENPVKFRNISRYNIFWEGGENSGNFDVIMRLHILEKNAAASNKWEEKVIDWKVVKEMEGYKYSIIGKDFYVFLQSNLEKNKDISRKFESFDLIVRGVGKELKAYKDVLNTNLGITSSQQIPTYTNLTNGYGVFTSINTETMSGFYLAKETRDSLRVGKFTKDLNFE